MNEIIKKLQNQYVRVSKNSITILNGDTFKTKGLIRNVSNYHTINNTDKMKFHNIWNFINNNNSNFEKTLYINGEWYFLISKNTLDTMHLFSQSEIEKINANIEMAKQNNIYIIECNIMG